MNLNIGLLIALWGLIFIVSKPQRKELSGVVKLVYSRLKLHKNIKDEIKRLECLGEKTDNDFLKGFCYGKAGMLKVELSKIPIIDVSNFY